jgi:hypothetical protein
LFSSQIVTSINEAVITEFPKLLDGLKIQMSSNLQVSVVLIKEHVKVLYEHENRAFTISTPSQKLGEKMTGLCGIKVFSLSLEDNTKFFVSLQESVARMVPTIQSPNLHSVPKQVVYGDFSNYRKV